MQWAVASAAFLASAVDFVEALTIVLVVGVTLNWRSALAGAFGAVATLAVIIATFGVALVQFVPLDVLRLITGWTAPSCAARLQKSGGSARGGEGAMLASNHHHFVVT
jgi:uncharacterized membrane protein